MRHLVCLGLAPLCLSLVVLPKGAQANEPGTYCEPCASTARAQQGTSGSSGLFSRWRGQDQGHQHAHSQVHASPSSSNVPILQAKGPNQRGGVLVPGAQPTGMGGYPGQAVVGAAPAAVVDPMLHRPIPYDPQAGQAAWGDPAPIGVMRTDYQGPAGMPGVSSPAMMPGPMGMGMGMGSGGPGMPDPAIRAWHAPGSPYQSGPQTSSRPGVLNKMLGIPNFGRWMEARRMKRALKQASPSPMQDPRGRPVELPAGLVY